MTTPIRTRSYAEVAQQLDAIADRTQPARTFDLLVRMLRLNDRKIEDRSGISRQTINGKRSGASPIRARDLWPLADALDVDVEVLLLPPSQAALWLVEHRADELDGQAPGKTEWANGSADQGDHGGITHRRRDYPCKRPVVRQSRRNVGCLSHLPHPDRPPMRPEPRCTTPPLTRS